MFVCHWYMNALLVQDWWLAVFSKFGNISLGLCKMILGVTLTPFLKFLFIYLFIYFKDFFYWFLDREEGRGREWERETDSRRKHPSAASHRPPTRDRARNLDMCLNWELSQQHSCALDDAQSLDNTGQGKLFIYFNVC